MDNEKICYMCGKKYDFNEARDLVIKLKEHNPFAARFVLEICPKCIKAFDDLYISIKEGNQNNEC